MITLWRRRPCASCQARISSSPVSSPAAPAGRLQRGGGHPGHLAQGLLELHHQRQPALGVSDAGAAGCTPASPGSDGHRVADLGVVLHGARPQRVGPEIDRELAVGQAGEVGDQVALGHLGQTATGRSRRWPPPGPVPRAGTSGTPVVRNDQALRPGMGELEQGGLGRRGPTAGAEPCRPAPRPRTGSGPSITPPPWPGPRRRRRSRRGSAARSRRRAARGPRRRSPRPARCRPGSRRRPCAR